MSGLDRPGLLGRLRSMLRRTPEHSLRESIAELMQEADLQEAGGEAESDDAPPSPGQLPELDRQERSLIANVLRLRGITADNVMVPRADIVAVPSDLTLDQVLAMFRREEHSRMPVYREQLDDIVGMVHVKDVLAYAGRPEAFALEAVLRRPLMVAPQVPVLDLLLQMRQARMHLALVVDEYGGIDGLVTIEDLVETITGDISDEHDDAPGSMMTERPDGALDLDGRLPIDELEARTGPVLTEEERDSAIATVGGLVFTLAGRVPARGEVIGHPSGLEFRVLDADARRIRRIRARRPEAAAQP